MEKIFILISAILLFGGPTKIIAMERLGETFNPTNYKIDLELKNDFATSNVFTGTVEITITQKTANAKNIRLHKADNITLQNVFIDGTPVVLTDIFYNPTSEIMEITLPNQQEVEGKVYALKIEYEGKFSNTTYGFYLSNVGKNNEVIAITQFAPTFARSAFPCFDEPAFKAIFAISIKVPSAYTALSNQAGTLIGSVNGPIYTFKPTPKMSPYLVTFVVSKFKSTPVLDVLTTPMAIWTPGSLALDAEYAASISYKILQNLGNLLTKTSGTNVQFDQMGMDHLDLIAISDFGFGSMENWGMVSYNENKLLWNNKTSSEKDKERIVRTITHEFSHSWFGNWVTTSWWNTIWLNEGFATYFEYHGLKGVAGLADYELEKQFVISVIHTILEIDGNEGTKALNADVTTVSETVGKYDDISYNKGASIIRMIKNLVGDIPFRGTLNTYIGAHKEGSVTPKILIDSFTENIDGMLISGIMGSWMDHPGYPVITAEVDPAGKQLILSQKQFVYQIPDNPSKTTTKSEWYVPITYQAIDTSVPVPQVAPAATFIVLKPAVNRTIPLKPNTTFILNPERAGYFRVNYDKILWKNITTILKNTPAKIDNITRAQLVDDAMNLARGGYLPYEIALDLVSYLSEETDYYTWNTAFSVFAYLRKRFVGEEVRQQVSQLLNNLMGNFYKEHKGFVIPKDTKPIQLYKKLLALEWACELNNADCTKKAKELFENMEKNPVDPNLQNIVYCSGLRSLSDNVETKWDLLWKKYGSSDSSNERVRILKALGCTTSATVLDKYLLKSINGEVRAHDAYLVFDSVLTGSPKGVDVAFKFLIKEFDTIVPKYGSTVAISEIVKQVADRLTTKDQLTKLKELVGKYGEQIGETGQIALKTTSANIAWVNEYKSKISTYLPLPNTSSGLVSSVLTLVICFVVRGLF